MSGAQQIPQMHRADRRGERGSRPLGRRNLGGFAALTGLVLVAAAPAQAQTMTQALAEAYNTNPQLLAQRALLRATDEQVPQALSGWRPTVNITGLVGGARSAFTTGSPVTGSRVSTYTTFYQNSLN